MSNFTFTFHNGMRTRVKSNTRDGANRELLKINPRLIGYVEKVSQEGRR